MQKSIGQYFSALALLLFGSGTCLAASSCLTGPLKQPHPHPYGNFNFDTNSIFDQARKFQGVRDPGPYKYAIISCVDNPDKSHALYVNWFIPGPNGWAPPGKNLDSVPQLTNESKPFQFNGCLLYGNRGDTTKAKFLGTAEDRRKVDDERRRGCRYVAAGVTSITEKIEKIVLRIENFFPSDIKRPSETMLQLEGVAEIQPEGADKFKSNVYYTITPYKNSKGKVGDVKLRADFHGSTEYLTPLLAKRYGTTVLKANTKGLISFEVNDVKNPKLSYASYEIIDRNEQIVGSITFPVFISKASRR